MSRIIRVSRNEPMDCAAVGKVLQRFIDDELDDGRSGRVAEHLAACSWCTNEADEFRTLKAALAHGRAPVDDVAARLRALGHELLGDHRRGD